MAWPLRFREGADFDPWSESAQIGDCWYMPHWNDDPERRQRFLANQASTQYIAQWADQRPPIFVQLPPGWPWCVDEGFYHPVGDPPRGGWTVTGKPEDGTLTVSPSINAVGTYHGWIQHGQVSDDVEGRHFP